MMMGMTEALHRVLRIGHIGQDDPHGATLMLDQGIKQIGAVHAGEAHVGHHRVKVGLPAQRHRFLGGSGALRHPGTFGPLFWA